MANQTTQRRNGNGNSRSNSRSGSGGRGGSSRSRRKQQGASWRQPDGSYSTMGLLRKMWGALPNSTFSQDDSMIQNFERFGWAVLGISLAAPLAAAAAIAAAPVVIAAGAGTAAVVGVRAYRRLSAPPQAPAPSPTPAPNRQGNPNLPTAPLFLRAPIRLSRPGGAIVVKDVEFAWLPYGAEQTWRSVEPVAAVQLRANPSGPIYHRALRLLPSAGGPGSGAVPPNRVVLHLACEPCRRNGTPCPAHRGVGGGTWVHVVPVTNPTVRNAADYALLGWADDFPSSGDPAHDEPTLLFPNKSRRTP